MTGERPATARGPGRAARVPGGPGPGRRGAPRSTPGRLGAARRAGRGRAVLAGQPTRYRAARRPDVIERLNAAGLLPAITFVFSRAGCDAAVLQCLNAGLRLTTPAEAAKITALVQERTADIPEEDLPVLGYQDWLTGLRRGIAAPHPRMLPTFQEGVEDPFAAGLIRAVF